MSEPWAKRLAMTHRIIEVLAICEASLNALAEAAGKMDLPQKRYRIRARRIKDAQPKGRRGGARSWNASFFEGATRQI